jgi:hypothetical protein
VLKRVASNREVIICVVRKQIEVGSATLRDELRRQYGDDGKLPKIVPVRKGRSESHSDLLGPIAYRLTRCSIFREQSISFSIYSRIICFVDSSAINCFTKSTLKRVIPGTPQRKPHAPRTGRIGAVLPVDATGTNTSRLAERIRVTHVAKHWRIASCSV